MHPIPKTSLISKKASQRAQRDIDFVCRQILRFAKMPLDERMAYLRKHPNEIFCRIPRHDGKGYLQCGTLGWSRFLSLTDLVLEIDTTLAQRVGRQQARAAVIDAFVKRVLHEGRDVNEETCELVISDTLAALKESLIVTEHYLPCVLFPAGCPDEFRVGPVTFSRRRKFFKDRRLVFKSSVEAEAAAHIKYVNAEVSRGFPRERAYTEAESKQHVRGLQARALKTYRQYPWVASVKVTDCDKDTSKKRAVRAVEMALHVIRVLLGAEPTRELRHAWSKSDALRTAHLYSDVYNVIHASVSMRALGPVSINDWHEALMQSSYELDVLGSVLKSIVDPIDSRLLHQRLVDAITWFGDAATDSNTSSSIVKYVSAIERLFFGKFEPGRTRAFAIRVKSVFAAFNCHGYQFVYDQALAVYKTRSALVHGEHLPIEDKANEVARLAAELSRMSILCSAQIFPMMSHAFDSPDTVKLEEVMKRISLEGLDWLAKASRFSK